MTTHEQIKDLLILLHQTAQSNKLHLTKHGFLQNKHEIPHIVTTLNEISPHLLKLHKQLEQEFIANKLVLPETK